MHKYFVLNICILITILTCSLFSQNKNDGWEAGSAYNKLIHFQKVDTLKGNIIESDTIVPLKGMSPGIQLIVKDGKKTFTVQVGPKWFAKMLNLKFTKNEKLEIEGWENTINHNPVLIAYTMEMKGEILHLRDDKGSPIWDRMR